MEVVVKKMVDVTMKMIWGWVEVAYGGGSGDGVFVVGGAGTVVSILSGMIVGILSAWTLSLQRRMIWTIQQI